MTSPSPAHELANAAFRLRIEAECVTLHDQTTGFCWSAAPYVYRASRPHEEGTFVHEKLRSVAVSQRGDSITISGILAGLRVEQRFVLPGDKPFMEERITLENNSASPVVLTDFEAGFQRRLTDAVARPLPEVDGDRFAAVPFRIRPTDSPGHVNDFSIGDLTTTPGFEMRQNDMLANGFLPSRHRSSEGWMWKHGEQALGLFKFNQDGMEFSVLSTSVREDGLWLRFGGACLVAGEPAALTTLAPGQKLPLGVTRYQNVKGDYAAVAYAFREMLDGNGCRFPRDYNPPVHWNELYDNPEYWPTTPGDWEVLRAGRERLRAKTYTREFVEQEAVKAKAYGCEALYLDPGWDTAFGTFLWDEARLGPLQQFVGEMKDRHGLAVALHCPLAPWVSHALFRLDDAGRASWPRDALRKDAQGELIEGSVCLGSRSYLDEAEKRLTALCAAGVRFLMFDGNFWIGGCWHPDHGHPVPYRRDDHIRANLELAQRIHGKFPGVLIEMHDMITGGTRVRWTPVYYKYGLPGSYDENWGFELMWNPFQSLRDGQARALYYYSLGCNVPVYLHIDLREDNEHGMVLWWFASTCRHLGIGGTHANPSVAETQKHAMRRYRQLERFYKRGEFIGVNEEIHLHVLREENAFVVNLFNLSDQRRRIEGAVPVERLGVATDRFYTRDKGWVWFDKNTLRVSHELPPWGTQMMELHAI